MNQRPTPGRRPPPPRHLINDRIRVPEVRVLGDEGEQLGVMVTKAALELARTRGVDLVLVAPTATPPVCRLVDYSKFKYQLELKERAQRQHHVETKEMKFRVHISRGDLDTKCRKINEILGRGDRVKVVVQLRGREVTHPELGRSTMDLILAATEGAGQPAGPVHNDGRNISVVLNPKKR